MGVYVTPAELRAMPEVPDAAPPSDAELEITIELAEDQIDEWLGLWEIDPATGRKIVEDETEPWRWAKLKRATARLAARLHGDPSLLEPAAYDRIKGPDFEREGPARPTARGRLADVSGPLNASGLRRLSARAHA